MRQVGGLRASEHGGSSLLPRLCSVPRDMAQSAGLQGFKWEVRDERQACGLCYTSGTTGPPKVRRLQLQAQPCGHPPSYHRYLALGKTKQQGLLLQLALLGACCGFLLLSFLCAVNAGQLDSQARPSSVPCVRCDTSCLSAAQVPLLFLLPACIRMQGVLYSHRSNFLHAFVIAMPDTLDLRGGSTILMVVPMFHANR